ASTAARPLAIRSRSTAGAPSGGMRTSFQVTGSAWAALRYPRSAPSRLSRGSPRRRSLGSTVASCASARAPSRSTSASSNPGRSLKCPYTIGRLTPASRATASIETAWNPCRSTIDFVTSISCSRRSSACIRTGLAACSTPMGDRCYSTVSYGYVASTLANRPRGAEQMNENEHFDVAILGSGFSGLGMAIRLLQQGHHDFVVLERADEVGGTWH